MRFLRFNPNSAPTYRVPGGYVGNFPSPPGLAHPKPKIKEGANYSVFLCTDPQFTQEGRKGLGNPLPHPGALGL